MIRSRGIKSSPLGGAADCSRAVRDLQEPYLVLAIKISTDGRDVYFIEHCIMLAK